MSQNMTLDRAYRLGYDCGLNGSNLTNCSHEIFCTPEHTKEWERGKREGEAIKKASDEKKDDSTDLLTNGSTFPIL